MDMTKSKKQKNFSDYLSRWIFKIILNSWTVIAIFIFCLDFFSGNKYDSVSSAIGIIYLAILGIYAGEKEYSRWKNHFISQFLGEAFVILWTIMMVIFVITAPLSLGRFRVPAELAIVYTSVVGIYIITKRSKTLHRDKK
jgi:hypothetical protein